jgi:predicted TPR repeat methyltransferase
VDLSGGMIEKARHRGGYDTLEVAELTGYLQAHPGAYDVVLSADTLVYFGELQEALTAAHAALRPGGWVAFTLEALDEDLVRVELTPSGRYRHTRRYIERVLAVAGFDRARIAPDVLRRESGEPVAGWVVLARHPAPAPAVAHGEAA